MSGAAVAAAALAVVGARFRLHGRDPAEGALMAEAEGKPARAKVVRAAAKPRTQSLAAGRRRTGDPRGLPHTGRSCSARRARRRAGASSGGPVGASGPHGGRDRIGYRAPACRRVRTRIGFFG